MEILHSQEMLCSRLKIQELMRRSNVICDDDQCSSRATIYIPQPLLEPTGFRRVSEAEWYLDILSIVSLACDIWCRMAAPGHISFLLFGTLRSQRTAAEDLSVSMCV